MNPTDVTDIPPSPSKPQREANATGWLLLALLLLVEYGLFRQFAEREVTWAPPLMHDQVTYLLRSYQIYEAILRDGPAQGIWHGVREPTANGVMLSLQGALLFLVLGASRLSALTLNFGYFAALQLTLAGTLRWLRGWSAAFLGVGLVLALHAPFFWAGGVMDFRIDCIAFCMFGIVLCLAVRSDLFADWRWSAACGAAAALLGLFRFITTLYLGVIGASFVLVLLVRLCLGRRSPECRRRTRKQLVGMAIVGAICAACCGPFLWHNRQILHDYYFVGTIAGGEKTVRQQEFGIFTRADALLYYPRSVYRDHTGLPFWLVSAGILTAAGALAAGSVVLGRWQSGPAASPLDRQVDLFSAYAALGLSLLVPLSILTAIPSKSPVVGSILVGPVIWLVLLSVLSLSGRAHRPRRAAETLFAAVALSAGLWVQLTNLVPHSATTPARPDMEQASELLDQIGQQCKAAGWMYPHIASTNFNHVIAPLLAEVLAYEKQHIVLHTTPTMPLSVFALNEAQATGAIGQSDFVILTRSRTAAASPFPFIQSMQELRPRLQRLCEQSFWPVGDYCILGDEVTLYRRPAVRIEGNDLDGWFAERDLVLHGNCAELRRFPHLELSGRLLQAMTPSTSRLEAQLVTGNAAPQSLPATLTIYGDVFWVRLDVPSASLPAEGEAKITLFFEAATTAPRPGMRKPVTVKLTPDA